MKMAEYANEIVLAILLSFTPMKVQGEIINRFGDRWDQISLDTALDFIRNVVVIKRHQCEYWDSYDQCCQRDGENISDYFGRVVQCVLESGFVDDYGRHIYTSLVKYKFYSGLRDPIMKSEMRMILKIMMTSDR